MPLLRLADFDCESTASPLGDCLIQLKGGPVKTATVPDETVRQDGPRIRDWKEQWELNREQISRRLALIEAELDRLAEEEGLNPKLSVYPDNPR